MDEPSKGLRLYARILHELTQCPRTAVEMLPVLGLDRNANRALFGQMHLRRLIHISSWNKVRNGFIAVWGAGNMPDAIAPMRADGKPGEPRAPAKFRSCSDLSAFREVITALEHPHTVTMLAEVTGLHRTSLNWLVRYMHDKRLIYICEWDREVAITPVATYMLGNERDKSRPRPMTIEEINTRKRDSAQAKSDAMRLLRALANVQQP
jgi:hypothetical protein